MKNLLLPALLMAAGPALAQTTPPASYPYHIKGQLGHYSAPAKVYLVRGTERLDSATLHNGQFELKGTVHQPISAALVLGRNGRLEDGWQEKMMGGQLRRYYAEFRDRHSLFLEPGPVVFTGSDSLRTASLSGGPLTADYQRLRAALQPVIDNVQKGAGSQAEFDATMKEYGQVQQSFIRANPSSWVSLEALQEQGGMMGPPKYTEVAPLYAALSPTLRNSPPGREYDAMLQKLKATAVGSPAPAFAQQTPDGKTVSLADYRGKYVLVDFWASWCGPCRAENPNVLAAYNAFKAKNFVILGVSLDEGREKWLKAVADDKMPWTQVSDLKGWENEVAQRYNVRSIPQNFLVDPSGKIVAANLRGPELEATLARLLK